MKIYAIGYEENISENTFYKYYIYTCKFFSERKEIEESFYEQLKEVFIISGNKNNGKSGIYFDSI